MSSSAQFNQKHPYIPFMESPSRQRSNLSKKKESSLQIQQNTITKRVTSKSKTTKCEIKPQDK